MKRRFDNMAEEGVYVDMLPLLPKHFSDRAVATVVQNQSLRQMEEAVVSRMF